MIGIIGILCDYYLRSGCADLGMSNQKAKIHRLSQTPGSNHVSVQVQGIKLDLHLIPFLLNIRLIFLFQVIKIW